MSKQFEKDLEKTLASGSGRVDQQTRNELARRRQHALDEFTRRRTFKWLWLPVGTLAAVVIAVVVSWPFAQNQMPVVAAESAELDLEILLADDFELYEDLEFYEWLDVIDDAG